MPSTPGGGDGTANVRKKTINPKKQNQKTQGVESTGKMSTLIGHLAVFLDFKNFCLYLWS